MITDRVGDFIVRLQNAAMAKKPGVSVPYSAHLEEIAKKLQTLGYIASVDTKSKPKKTLEITLVTDARGNARLQGVKRVSKPGRRLYVSTREAHGVKNGSGARILSTPRGILSDAEARKVRMGGENLFEIW
ncbi:MAG TPA: 30S ribosomal protein S8 [Candidatus Paceibacterota bacterium]